MDKIEKISAIILAIVVGVPLFIFSLYPIIGSLFWGFSMYFVVNSVEDNGNPKYPAFAFLVGIIVFCVHCYISLICFEYLKGLK